MGYRTESDTLGEIQVAAEKYWGAQTQRSFENFKIGDEHFSTAFISAYARLKKACAVANNLLGKLDEQKLNAISRACDEIVDGKLSGNFPLVVWQTGSGTQTNMNLNEVVANRASELMGGEIGSKRLVHPNDDVNKSQSSNDSFPAAMHVAAALELVGLLLPALDDFASALAEKEIEYADIIKTGRTHLQDAVPLTLGQEFSGYRAQIEQAKTRIEQALTQIVELPIGGTAVGTGLNAPDGFDQAVCDALYQETDVSFLPVVNKFSYIAAHDSFAGLSGSLAALAAAVMKIANDIRWLGSGPRCGIGELILPANEPGSSIMPGKVNPTQSEALTMVAAQVVGNNTTVTFACSQGNFELNVFKPVIIYNVLQSIRLLADGLNSFRKNCLVGLKPDEKKVKEYVDSTLMVVTALNPHIGYESSAKIAKKAYGEGISLKEAGVALGLLSEEDYDAWVDLTKMV